MTAARQLASFLGRRPDLRNGAWPDYLAILERTLEPRDTEIRVRTREQWADALARGGAPERWVSGERCFVARPFERLRGHSPVERRYMPPLPQPTDLPAAGPSRHALASAAARAARVEQLWREAAWRLSFWGDGLWARPVFWGSARRADFPRPILMAEERVAVQGGRFWWLARLVGSLADAAAPGTYPPPSHHSGATPSGPYAGGGDPFADVLWGDYFWRACAAGGARAPEPRGPSEDGFLPGAVAGRPFAGLLNPFEPALALLDEGFLWTSEVARVGGRVTDVVVLVAPEF